MQSTGHVSIAICVHHNGAQPFDRGRNNSPQSRRAFTCHINFNRRPPPAPPLPTHLPAPAHLHFVRCVATLVNDAGTSILAGLYLKRARRPADALAAADARQLRARVGWGARLRIGGAGSGFKVLCSSSGRCSAGRRKRGWPFPAASQSFGAGADPLQTHKAQHALSLPLRRPQTNNPSSELMSRKGSGSQVQSH